ncbi:zinc finger protein 84-like isoform X2 [Bradysia coprophila]|uniref:zinc finger protein 84-like isoform X2 n=1 Tax=Bradysia coprophila TaxID=38358 RepID=UPI00187DD3FA|nr:zinc finger protein 84-like isoform X2 [Bradysia coprophila]
MGSTSKSDNLIMELSFIKKEEPVDYDLIDDSDIYTITIKEEPTSDWSSGYDAITLKSEDCAKNETLSEVENFDVSCHQSKEWTGAGNVSTTATLKSKVHQQFWCYECHTVFERKSYLTKHLKIHGCGSDKGVCSVCKKSFPKSIIRFHELFFHQGPPYRCSICDKEFKAWTGFRQHRKLHRDKLFECDVCHKHFMTKGNLESHIQTHIEREKTFQCKLCGHRFFRKNTLLRHIRNLHTSRTKSVCSGCNQAYFRLKEHKCDQPSKRIHCDKCAKVFFDPFKLVLHAQQNCAEQIVYECALCTRKVPNKQYIRRHFAKYHLVKGQSFKKPNDSNAFECDCCRKVFQYKSSCIRHEKNCKLRTDWSKK